VSDLKKPLVMTREQVKLFLGITDATYDNQIDLFLPIVTDDIERILNNKFVLSYDGNLESGNPIITDIQTDKVEINSVVTCLSVSNDFVVDIDTVAGEITLDGSPTTTAQDTQVLINIFPQAKKHVAAKMVWHQILHSSIDTAISPGAKSESWANYAITYADNDAGTIAGYPAMLIASLQELKRPRFY
jgi:hypothetical protein